MDWRARSKVLDAACAWAREEIDRGLAEVATALVALLQAGRADDG
jgi:hypothetical protein